MKKLKTPLEAVRLKYDPPLPEILTDLTHCSIEGGSVTTSVADEAEIQKFFPSTFGRKILSCTKGALPGKCAPLRVGVMLSGGQAPGGHNVITGLFDALKKLHSDSRLFGFLCGPIGIVDNKHVELTAEILADYRNTGGFDLLGSGRTKVKTDEQLACSLKVIQDLKLDGLVIIGGEGSNAYCAVLAEYLLKHGCQTRVVGIPKTIDGDLQDGMLEVSFGFDTACKIYAELVGNIARDAISSKKYYHFIKLMGRSASHITLECALQTHPNMALICEEIVAEGKDLEQIADELAEMVYQRSQQGKEYGVVLIPEGLIEFIPKMMELIKELNPLLAKYPESEIAAHLSEKSRAAFDFLPLQIRQQLLSDRDHHGNVKLSHIATEQLLIHAVKEKLKQKEGYKGQFTALSHFFGYEGRSGFPSNFDASYCYALGHTAALLIQGGYTGYMAVVHHLGYHIEDWKAGGIPITMLMSMDKRPVIKKTLVDIHEEPFIYFDYQRGRWAMEDDYRYPGPIQYDSSSLSEQPTFTLLLRRR